MTMTPSDVNLCQHMFTNWSQSISSTNLTDKPETSIQASGHLSGAVQRNIY